MWRRKGAVWILAPVPALAIAAALTLPDTGCQDFPPVELCGEIPEGGCPAGRGGSCDDDVCAGLYDCVHGEWTEVKHCSREADAGGGGGDAGDAGDMDAQPDACTPVAIDHAGEITGCHPDLQNPDCPAVAAEPCAETACLTGCVDFYMCTAGGWTPVAYCTDDGELVVMP